MRAVINDFFICLYGINTGVSILYYSTRVEFMVHLNNTPPVSLYRKALTSHQKLWASDQIVPDEMLKELGALIKRYLHTQTKSAIH